MLTAGSRARGSGGRGGVGDDRATGRRRVELRAAADRSGVGVDGARRGGQRRGGRRRREEDEDGPATGRLRAAWGAGEAMGFVPPIRSGSGRRGESEWGGASGERGVADRLGFQSGWGLRGGRLGQVGRPGR